MSVISVYRHFYWTESRLAGQTGHIWETKEEQARCIKEPPDGMMLTSGVQPVPPSIPPTKDMQRADARYHISNQHCLCGIFGYFSPSYLGLMMTSGNGPGAVDHEGSMVFARIRLGGLVDIHGMGARGEYGLIEEAWCDDKDIVDAIAKQYDIPVNKSEYEKQPRTDPILSGEAKIVKLSPMFAGMPEAMAMQNSLGLAPGPAVGIQTVITPTMIRQARATPGSTASSQQMRQIWNAKVGGTPPPCSAPSGSNCQCGACAFRGAMGAPSAPGIGVPGMWKCRICGSYEIKAIDHTVTRCSAALPLSLPMPGSIGVGRAHKPGIIARLKRAFGI